ncbi:RNA-binding protein 8A, partial [Podochytrium sp. JEL0797]
MASNLVELDAGADDLTAMMVDEDPSANLKQNATRKKGRGFEGNDSRDDNINSGQFDVIGAAGTGTAATPQKSVEGWIVLVTGIHEEATEDDVKEKFADFGEIKNLHLNLDRRSGFVKGYALIEYNTLNEAKSAISETNGTDLLGKKIFADFAFVTGPRASIESRLARRQTIYSSPGSPPLKPATTQQPKERTSFSTLGQSYDSFQQGTSSSMIKLPKQWLAAREDSFCAITPSRASISSPALGRVAELDYEPEDRVASIDGIAEVETFKAGRVEPLKKAVVDKNQVSWTAIRASRDAKKKEKANGTGATV